MTKALLLVESKPESPEQVDAYNDWHEKIHIPEMLKIDGIASARRWRSDNGDSFMTLYELETDVDTAKAKLRAAVQSGQMSKPVAVQTNPPAVMRYFNLISEA